MAQIIDVGQILADVERPVLAEVMNRLAAREKGQWPADDDSIFEPFNNYVASALPLGLSQRAVRLWRQIGPEATRVDAALSRPMHKGSPLYNVGLCYFILGNHDRAAQYIEEASVEDTRRAGGAPSRLRLGEGLSEQFLINPLDPWMHTTFGATYQSATSSPLSKLELKARVNFLEPRSTDAVVFLAALHRMKTQLNPPDNAAAGLHRARALADLLVVLESCLKRVLSRPGDALRTLCNTLTAGTRVGSALGAADARDAGATWDTPATVNSMIQRECGLFSGATRAEKAGIALYVSCRLRNALLHVLDPALSIYSGGTDLKEATAFALISIRLAELGTVGVASL